MKKSEEFIRPPRHNGHLGKCLLLHFPVGMPVSLPFMAICICDFVSSALVVSLKCNEVSSGATKHQRPPQTSRNSGSGVPFYPPASLQQHLLRPACDDASVFHSDLLVNAEHCAYASASHAPTKADSEGLWINPDTRLATFYYVWFTSSIFILFNQFSTINTIMVTMETIASASPRHRNLP